VVFVTLTLRFAGSCCWFDIDDFG